MEWITLLVLIGGFSCVVWTIDSLRREVVRVYRELPNLNSAHGMERIARELDNVLSRLRDILAALDPEFAEKRRRQLEMDKARDEEVRVRGDRIEKRQNDFLSQFDNKKS